MTLFLSIIAVPLLGALLAYQFVGRSGPVYERRYGLLTFPDSIFTLPLALTIALFWVEKWPFVPRFSALFYLALCSFALCTLMALAYWTFSSWTRFLPNHMKLLTYARLGASRYRTWVRTALWLGLLAEALDASQVPHTWVLATPGFVYIFTRLPFLNEILSRANIRSQNGGTPYQEQYRAFDVFVSYKSQNVDAARRFADLALANGLKPWFAEYLIRFHARDKFEREINKGAADSRAAILFTGFGYFESKHCIGELEQVIRKCGSFRILEVHSPGETNLAEWCRRWEQDKGLQEKHPWVTDYLAEMRRIASVSVSDEQGVINAAREVLQLKIEKGFVTAPSLEPETRFRGLHSGIPFSIVTSGWQEVAAPSAAGITNPDLKITPGFWRQFSSGNITWEIILGPIVRRIVDPAYGEIPPSDDDNRWLYNEYRGDSMIWLAENASECHGVHLFWFNQGDQRPHLLLSYWGERLWHRRYMIVLEPEALDERATFSFAFLFSGTFQEFCRHTPIMDAVVRSLRWEM